MNRNLKIMFCFQADFKETSVKSLEKAKSSSKLNESAMRGMANMRIN